MPMGVSVEEFQSKAAPGGAMTCLDESADGLKSCFGPTSVTYADQQLISISGDFLNNRLASISMQASGGTAGIIIQAVTSKYGGASTTRQLKQTNNNGTYYFSTLTEWKLKMGERIAIQDHPRPHNKVYVTLESNEKLQWFRRVQTATPKAKKDI